MFSSMNVHLNRMLCLFFFFNLKICIFKEATKGLKVHTIGIKAVFVIISNSSLCLSTEEVSWEPLSPRPDTDFECLALYSSFHSLTPGNSVLLSKIDPSAVPSKNFCHNFGSSEKQRKALLAEAHRILFSGSLIFFPYKNLF